MNQEVLGRPLGEGFEGTHKKAGGGGFDPTSNQSHLGPGMRPTQYSGEGFEGTAVAR